MRKLFDKMYDAISARIDLLAPAPPSIAKSPAPLMEKPPSVPAVQNAPPISPPTAAPAPTSNRAELIRRAMEVRQAKQTVLDSLSTEQRAKLMALATALMMGTKKK